VDQDAEALANIGLVFNDGDADRLGFSRRLRRLILGGRHVCSLVQKPGRLAQPI
jgi:hypothetical protein